MIFGNGYLSLTLRLTNSAAVTGAELVESIRQPELVEIKHSYRDDVRTAPPLVDLDDESHAGALVDSAVSIARALEDQLWAVLVALRLRRLTFDQSTVQHRRKGPRGGRWQVLGENQSSLSYRPTRPCVGVIFKLESAPVNDVGTLLVDRFIIAVGRTTPAFLTSFKKPSRYLAAEDRNVYGQGGSKVFVGRRGWCVYDAGEHEASTFRIGVVEATHLVITALDTAARARRRYGLLIRREGLERLRELNLRVFEYINAGYRRFWFAQRRYRRALKGATAFLAQARLMSPSGDMSALLEAHVISHTARAGLRRYARLVGLDNLAAANRETLESYAAFVATSSDYLALLTTQFTRRALIIGLIALLAAIAGVVMPLF